MIFPVGDHPLLGLLPVVQSQEDWRRSGLVLSVHRHVDDVLQAGNDNREHHCNVLTAECWIILLEIFTLLLLALQLELPGVLLRELGVEAELLTGPVLRPVSEAGFPLVSLAQTLSGGRSRTFLLSQLPSREYLIVQDRRKNNCHTFWTLCCSFSEPSHYQRESTLFSFQRRNIFQDDISDKISWY